MNVPVYMDFASTTPMDVRVLEAMRPFQLEIFGNPSSTHTFGRQAGIALKSARRKVAKLINANEREIVFTSGATESNNLAIIGVARRARLRGTHLVTAATEHHSVLDSFKQLESEGFSVTVLPVDTNGQVNPEQVRQAIRADTILASIMFANNEVGTLHPIRQVGQICHDHGVPLHCDATQAVGKVRVDVAAEHVDLLSISAHKFYGPKGVGVLYVNQTANLELDPLFHGGGQERGLRSGTVNVAGAVGLARACELCEELLVEEIKRIENLRQQLHQGILRCLDGVGLNGHPTDRVAGILSLSFDDIDAESFMAAIPALAVSATSACTTARMQHSHVLRAINLSPEMARGTIRFSLGRSTTTDEVEWAVQSVVRTVRRLRERCAA
jgi:cysteine desulfurase